MRKELMETNEALFRKNEEDVGKLIKDHEEALKVAVEKAVADEKLAQRTRKPSGDMNFLGRRAMVQEHERELQATRKHFEELLQKSEKQLQDRQEKWYKERETLYSQIKLDLESEFAAKLRSKLEKKMENIVWR